MQNLNKKKQNHTFHFTHRTSQKGITLIALIITIIVMLILVGVTINVALNGGLFQKAETATYQTEASLVKEQLEIAKAIELANAEGKKIEDYSYIKVENLDGLDQETRTKFKDIILVNSNGDICYNPEKVTAEQKTGLEAIGIKLYENNPQGNEPTGTDYSFTLNELGERLQGEESWIIFKASAVWETIGKDLSEESSYYRIVDGLPSHILETESELFGNVLHALEELEVEEKMQFNIVTLLNKEEDVMVFVCSKLDGSPAVGNGEGEMTAEEFMNTYGNVEFRFVEESEYGL